jgi:hypothetical protein
MLPSKPAKKHHIILNFFSSIYFAASWAARFRPACPFEMEASTPAIQNAAQMPAP